MNAKAIKNGVWEAEAKWGKAVSGGQTGFHIVPDVLVRGQYLLGISSTEMVVLLNILLHWWDLSHLPHPRPSVIARRMGVSTRTVERAIESLEGKELIRRLPPQKPEKGPTVRKFDLRGLVEAVNRLADAIRPAA